MAMDLKRRVATALALLPLAEALVLFAPTAALALVAAAVFAVAALEWAPLAGAAEGATPWLCALVLLAVLAGLWQFAFELPAVGRAVLAAGLAWWTLALIWLLSRAALPRAFKLGAGLLTLAPAWYAVVTLHGLRSGPALLLLLLLMIWAADVGAFFAGHAFGEHKLAPEVSPGKTWEGVLGGFALSAAVAAVGAWLLGFAVGSFVLLSLATIGASIVGDLTESLLKRQAGAKDSGVLLPGHGGVLDRLDSLFSAGPVFLAGWLLLGGGA
jgi:phosphatidate cytidylyltransferase